MKSVEAMQEKMCIAMEDQSRAMQETMEALLSEVILTLTFIIAIKF